MQICIHLGILCVWCQKWVGPKFPSKPWFPWLLILHNPCDYLVPTNWHKEPIIKPQRNPTNCSHFEGICLGQEVNALSSNVLTTSTINGISKAHYLEIPWFPSCACTVQSFLALSFWTNLHGQVVEEVDCYNSERTRHSVQFNCSSGDYIILCCYYLWMYKGTEQEIMESLQYMYRKSGKFGIKIFS